MLVHAHVCIKCMLHVKKGRKERRKRKREERKKERKKERKGKQEGEGNLSLPVEASKHASEGLKRTEVMLSAPHL